jgi:two-component system cell cycle sensor histidine kinase/response regulator CckA
MLENASAPKSSVAPRTILVVDDEPMVREFAHRLLEAEGHVVLEAGSGQEALRTLRERADQIHGVLLDLSMPGMDGTDLLSALRTFAPALPVIVHSGYPVDATAESLAPWHVAGVLQKPYRAARLTEMVRKVFTVSQPG